MKDFIICDSCLTKIKLGEDVEVSTGIGDESNYYCSSCFCLRDKLCQEYLDDFWAHRDKSDYDFDDYGEDTNWCDGENGDSEFKNIEKIYGNVPDQDD